MLVLKVTTNVTGNLTTTEVGQDRYIDLTDMTGGRIVEKYREVTDLTDLTDLTGG